MTEPAIVSTRASVPSRGLLVATGVVLIVAPLVATALKILFPGWYLAILVFTGIPVLLAIGYAMQIVIAATGFLSRRALFATTAGARRAIIAAWISPVALLLTVFFMPEGGDTSFGSIFAILIGAQSQSGANDLSSVLFSISAGVWAAGWVWLLVEWIIAIAARRRTRAQAAPAA